MRCAWRQWLCAILLGAGVAFPLRAQTVLFRVEEAENGEPLSGVVIRAVRIGGQTVHYALTDREGLAEIPLTQSMDTLKVSLLGFRERSFLRPFRDRYLIQLETAPLQIRPAGVTAHKVEEVGDTIRYNVKALKNQEDLVLSDFLKRLPGVDVSKAGYVKYNGRDINRFYVDGKDILESNYNLATRHLSVDAVRSVEILQNHQPIRMLQGIKESDRAAMNIVLDENTRSKVTGSASVAAGVATAPPTVPLAGELSAFYVAPSFSSVDVAGYDGQGNALKELDLTLQQDRSYWHVPLRKRIGMGGVPAPLEEKRSLFNQTVEASTVNRFSSKETEGLSSTVKYASDRKESSAQTVSSYRNAGAGDRTFIRSEDRITGQHQLTGILSYTDNSTKHYVKEKLYADFGREEGLVAVTGDWERSQQANQKGWTLENEATLGTRLEDKIIRMTSFTQWSGVEESLSLGVPGQEVKSSLFDQQLSFSNISHARGRWRMSANPKAEVTVHHRDNQLTGISEYIPGVRKGTTRASLWQAGVTAGLSYDGAPFLAEAEGTLLYAFCRIGERVEGRGIGKARLSMKYVAGRWECRLHGEGGVQAPDIQGAGDAIILTGYQSLWKGTEVLLFTPYASSSIEFLYRAPVSGWNFRTTAGIRRSEGNASARDIFPDFILSYVTDNTYAIRSGNVRTELSKGLFSINGKASASLEYRHSASVFQQDGRGVGYGSGTLSTSGQLSMTLFRRWCIVTDIRADRYHYLTDGRKSDTNIAVKSKYRNTVSFSDAWSGSAGVDVHYDSSIDKAFVFPDFAVIWRGKKGLRIRLEAINLLDRREYAYVLLSPLLEESYHMRIRPLTVLIGADWQF